MIEQLRKRLLDREHPERIHLIGVAGEATVRNGVIDNSFLHDQAKIAGRRFGAFLFEALRIKTPPPSRHLLIAFLLASAAE